MIFIEKNTIQTTAHFLFISTETTHYIWKLSTVMFNISRHRNFGGTSFLLFTMTSTIIFSVLLILCQFGDHVLLFPCFTSVMLLFSKLLWGFFFFTSFFISPTDPKSGNPLMLYERGLAQVIKHCMINFKNLLECLCIICKYFWNKFKNI